MGLIRTNESHISTGTLRTLFLVSRPALWHFTGVVFMIPAATAPAVLLRPKSVLGLLFALLPVNVVVYGLNDLKDVDIDRTNPRKGGLQGARASAEELRQCLAIGLAAVMLLPPLLTGEPLWSLAWAGTSVLTNCLYNFGPTLSRVPVLDLLPPLGYLLLMPFASKVFGPGHEVAPLFGAYMAAMAVRTQIWFQRFDAVDDAGAGKRTTAVALGPRLAAAAVAAALLAEWAIARAWSCPPLQMFSCYSACVLGLELLVGSQQVTSGLMGLGTLASFLPVLRFLAA